MRLGLARNGGAGRGDVRALGVTDVLPSMRPSDKTKTGPACGALFDVAPEVVAQLTNLDIEQVGQSLLDLLRTVAADHGLSEATASDVGITGAAADPAYPDYRGSALQRSEDGGASSSGLDRSKGV